MQSDPAKFLQLISSRSGFGGLNGIFTIAGQPDRGCAAMVKIPFKTPNPDRDDIDQRHN